MYDLGDNTSNYNYGRINWNGTTFTVTDGYGNHPVVNVSWFGAYAFSEYYGLSLPNEFEWEKAARGILGFDYPWGDENPVCDFNAYNGVNFSTCYNGTTPVGSFINSFSPYGLNDMAGNVMEWTSSWFDNINYNLRSWRGGEWGNGQNVCRSWRRDGNSPILMTDDRGFRVARRLY